MLFKQKLEKPWKGLGVSSPSHPPLLQVCIIIIIIFIHGRCLAMGSRRCSLNSYNGMVTGDQSHRPLKCACQDGITAACPLLWNRMQAEEEQNNQYRDRKNRDHSCWGDPPPPARLLPQTSSCTSSGCVEDALLPTELIRTEWSTAGRSWRGLQFARLE